MTHKEFSRKGGKSGLGESKARTSEQARAAVQARWKKHRKTKRVTAKPNAPADLPRIGGAQSDSDSRSRSHHYESARTF